MLNGLACWARISRLILATFWGLSPPANVIDASGMRSWMALAIFAESSTLMGIALPADKSMMNLLVASWYNLHCSAIRSGLQSSSSTAARVICRMMTAWGVRRQCSVLSPDTPPRGIHYCGGPSRSGAPTIPCGETMTNLFSTKKVLSVLLLIAIIAAAAVFLLTARGNPPVAATSHDSVSGDAELEDLQFVADAKGITLDEAIARYGWRDDFSAAVGAIRDNDPSSLAGAAITSTSSATINFSGSISADAQSVIDDFETENPNITTSTQTNLGYTEKEAEEAVVGAYFAVIEENGVEDGTAYFDDETNQIVIAVNMVTPPSDEEKAALERAAERGAKEATRPDITDTFTISLSVVEAELGGNESGSAPVGSNLPKSRIRSLVANFTKPIETRHSPFCSYPRADLAITSPPAVTSSPKFLKR